MTKRTVYAWLRERASAVPGVAVSDRNEIVLISASRAVKRSAIRVRPYDRRKASCRRSRRELHVGVTNCLLRLGGLARRRDDVLETHVSDEIAVLLVGMRDREVQH